MKVSLDAIKFNLNLLKEVKLEYPIIQDYEDGKVSKSTVSNIGFDSFITLIDYIKQCDSSGLKLIYDEEIKFRNLKSKILELNKVDSDSIFKNKTRKKFDEIWNDYKLIQKYKNSRNRSYAPGLMNCEPMIVNYLHQNGIEVCGEYIFNWKFIWFDRMSKPKFYSRELKMTQEFIDNFINFAKSSNLDIRKCNIQSLTSELNQKLKDLSKIDAGLQVTCLSEVSGFNIGETYTVEDSRINYYGFVEIKLKGPDGSVFVPYSAFEEISRKRDDILAKLGL